MEQHKTGAHNGVVKVQLVLRDSADDGVIANACSVTIPKRRLVTNTFAWPFGYYIT